jgi:hypothetical protein
MLAYFLSRNFPPHKNRNKTQTGSPDEEEKEDMDSEGAGNEVEDSRTHLEEPLRNDRFFLDNGEGTCEIKE